MKLKYVFSFFGVLVIFYSVLGVGLQQKDIYMTEYTMDSKTVTSQADKTGASSATSSVVETEPITEVETTPQNYLIEDFEVIFQEPELPTGCEITAMTMVLNYYGFDVDKVTMATEYLPVLSYSLYYDDYGTLIGNDLYNYFLGDPATTGGVTCGAGAITTAANAYLQYQDTDLTAVDMTGIEVDKLYEYIAQDIPVMVFVTIGMVDRFITNEWYTIDGQLCNYSTVDHGAVLIGYSDDTVTLADPISGIYECSRLQFESVFESRDNQCVILEDSLLSDNMPEDPDARYATDDTDNSSDNYDNDSDFTQDGNELSDPYLEENVTDETISFSTDELF